MIVYVVAKRGGSPPAASGSRPKGVEICSIYFYFSLDIGVADVAERESRLRFDFGFEVKRSGGKGRRFKG